MDFTESLKTVLNTEAGLYTLMQIFMRLGHFNYGEQFVGNAAIYKNMARLDIARWLEAEVDKAGRVFMERIKAEKDMYLKSIKRVD